MRLHTASEVISLIRLLENETAEFYEQLCRLGKYEEDLRGFARENHRNIVQVQQAYNSVISDALEGGFAFDIEANEFEFTLPKDVPLTEALKGAVEIETRLARLYSLAAEQSLSLLADVPRVFRLISQKRKTRIAKLESLLNGLP